MVHELLFLVTRQLLPNQIMANREFLRRLYTEKQRVQKRLMLRYDMLHAWKKDDYGRLIIVPSKRSHVPTHVHATQVSASSIAMSQVPDAINDPPLPIRRPLASNILSTLIAAPVEGYSTQITAEKMNHYITRLDDYLVITDSEAETWSMKMLEVKVAEILLSWQWLRINNEKLEELEVHGWEGLTGKEAEDWMADR
jgi:hypothetical protein